MNPTWQKNLKDNTKYRDLYTPGTHNSGTYLIDWGKDPLKYGGMSKYIVPFRPIIKTLVKNQTKTIDEQLKDGIRFFDLRVARLSIKEAPKADRWKINGVKQNYSLWISHTWICQPLEEVLRNIFQYVIDNPSEFITLQVKNDWDDREDISKSEVIKLVRNFATENNYSIHQKVVKHIENDEVRILRGKVFISQIDSRWYDASTSINLLSLLKIDFSKNYQRNYSVILTPNSNIVILTLILLSLFYILFVIILIVIIIFITLSLNEHGDFRTALKKELFYLIIIETVLAVLCISIHIYNKKLYQKGTSTGENIKEPGVISVDFYNKKFLDKRIGLNDFLR